MIGSLSMHGQRIVAERDSSETRRGPVVHALTNRPPLPERTPLPSVRELPMNDLRKTSSIASLVASFAGHATNASLVRAEFHIRAVLVTLVLVTSSFLCGQARAAGDAAAGKTVFANQCASCHTTEVGKNGFGPSLAAVLGRKAGGLAGFTYSPAMAQAGLTWDEKAVSKGLAGRSAILDDLAAVLAKVAPFGGGEVESALKAYAAEKKIEKFNDVAMPLRVAG